MRCELTISLLSGLVGSILTQAIIVVIGCIQFRCERKNLYRAIASECRYNFTILDEITSGTVNAKGSFKRMSVEFFKTIRQQAMAYSLRKNLLQMGAYAQRAYAEICAAKGFWNDDEELMMAAARRYVVAIRGIDMIQNAHSMYSVSAYTTVIEKLKNEFDEKEFKALCTQTKLYKVDIVDDPMTTNPCSRLGQDKY